MRYWVRDGHTHCSLQRTKPQRRRLILLKTTSGLLIFPCFTRPGHELTRIRVRTKAKVPSRWWDPERLLMCLESPINANPEERKQNRMERSSPKQRPSLKEGKLQSLHGTCVYPTTQENPGVLDVARDKMSAKSHSSGPRAVSKAPGVTLSLSPEGTRHSVAVFPSFCVWLSHSLDADRVQMI